MIKIIIVDDHAIVRQSLSQVLLLEESLGISQIDEAESGEELIEKLRKNRYNLIILDISMPGIGGVETLKEIKADRPEIPVLVLSTYSEEQYAVRVLKAGASGYLRKTNSTDELIIAIKRILQGRKYFSPFVAEKLLEMTDEKMPHEMLSDREFQILYMIALGKTQKEISEDLHLSIKTVSTYRTRILEKLGMKNNYELTEYCLSNGLILSGTPLTKL